MKSLKTPGKINLFLDVTGKRADGYHEILTLFLPVDLCDTVTLTDSSMLSLNCDRQSVPCDQRNLCWKAAELFAAAAGISPQWHINIHKNIPVAGGMGGGSSDAAAVLRMLNELYPAQVSKSQLAEIALKIGADVPYFLNPVPAIAAGIGEKLEPLTGGQRLHILLMTFKFPIPAVWAYKNRQRAFGQSTFDKTKLVNSWQKSSAQELAKIVYNDLAFAVRDKFPILQQGRSDLLNGGAAAAEVSGSGPSLFALFNKAEERDLCRSQLIEAGYNAQQLISASAG